MIIDGHAYCFPAREESAGYASPDERWRQLQLELSGHHQPVWRVCDRAPADNSTLVDAQTGELHDVEFTVHRNRFTWDYQGETYTKQYYPPMLFRGDAPAELLITEMDYAGIDLALLHTSPKLGRLNDYLATRTRQLTKLPGGSRQTVQPFTSFTPSFTTWAATPSSRMPIRCARSGTASRYTDRNVQGRSGGRDLDRDTRWLSEAPTSKSTIR